MKTASLMPTTKRATFVTVAGRAAPGAADAEMIISTRDLDRESDELMPEGCDSRNYQRNPVVLFGHSHFDVPIGTCTALTVEGNGIRAAWRWLQNDPFADRVRNAYDQGVLRAASVGFRPLAYEPNQHGGLTFTRWELLEFSLVPVPANPQAVRTLKRLGLDGPTGPSRIALLAEDLTASLKAGRVLSSANEARIRAAVEALTEVLQQIDDTSDDEKADVAVLVTGDPSTNTDDGLIHLSEEQIDHAVRSVVHQEIERAMGRVVDDDTLFTPAQNEPVIYLTDAELATLIKDNLRAGIASAINRITGRVD